MLRNDEDGLVLKVTAGAAVDTVKVLGGQGSSNPFKQVKIGGLDFAFKYGSRVLELPFDIKLNDFIAERYAGVDPDEVDRYLTVIEGRARSGRTGARWAMKPSIEPRLRWSCRTSDATC